MKSKESENKVAIVLLSMLCVLLLMIIVAVIYAFTLGDKDDISSGECNEVTEIAEEQTEEKPEMTGQAGVTTGDEDSKESDSIDEDEHKVMVVIHDTDIFSREAQHNIVKKNGKAYDDLKLKTGDKVTLASSKGTTFYRIENIFGQELYEKKDRYLRMDYEFFYSPAYAKTDGDNLYVPLSALVPEIEYNRYVELHSKIYNEFNLSKIESKSEPELYFDFDNDGVGELYIVYKYINVEKDVYRTCVYYADDNYLHEFNENEFYETDVTEKTYNSWAVMPIGEKKAAIHSSYTYPSEHTILNVENNKPVVVKIDGLSAIYDWIGHRRTNDLIKVYNSSGEFYYAKDIETENVLYPTWYINSEVVECLSTVVDKNQFLEIDGAEEFLKTADRNVRELNEMNQPSEGDYYFYIDDTEVSSIYYNDIAGFVVNFKIDVEFLICDYNYDPPFQYVDKLKSKNIQPWMAHYDEEHMVLVKEKKADAEEVDTDVDKLSAHVYAKYENGKFVIYNVGLGDVELGSGDYENVVESDFDSFIKK